MWSSTVGEQELLYIRFPWPLLLLGREQCFFENAVPALYGSVSLWVIERHFPVFNVSRCKVLCKLAGGELSSIVTHQFCRVSKPGEHSR